VRLLSVLKHHSKTSVVVMAILLGLVSGACSTLLIHVIKTTVLASDPSERKMLMWSFVGLALLAACFRTISTLVLLVLGARAASDWQVGLSRKILASPLRRLEEMGSHRMMVALTSDIMAVSNALANVPILFINGTVVVGCLIYLAWISWHQLIFVLIALILGVATYQGVMMGASRRMALARDAEDELFKHFRSVTQGAKELKLRRSRRHAFLELLSGSAAEVRDLRIGALRLFVAAANFGNLLFLFALGVILYVVPIFRYTTLDTTSSYVLGILYLMGPLQMILTSIPGMTQADASVKKIERMGISLTEDPAESESIAHSGVVPGWEKLELKGVSLTYTGEEEGSRFTLGPLDLTFKPGEMVFLVGGNGSGKTTLAKLIVGLYVQDTGRLLWNGEPVTDENRDAFRQGFSTVFSDFFLFETLLGLDSPQLDDKARRYLTDLRLKHKVRIQNGKLSTIELSQGQKKRLALLTAYLEDNPFFVFDEWAADQDPEFKRIFYYQILPDLRARGKTILVISHDDRFFHIGDRIIRLDYGQVTEDQPVAESARLEAAAR
jgi:putative ATP-binding cassette transporter